MKKVTNFITAIGFLLLLSSSTQAQVTELTINGQTSGISVVQGSNLSWEVTLPAGHSCTLELWIDVNQNGQVDPGTDRPAFKFTQTDGQAGGDGPGDRDESANGVIISDAQGVSLAPVHWVMRAADNGVGLSLGFNVTPMNSPPFTISGTVSAPEGVDKSYILFNAGADLGETNDKGPEWMGITDASGNYTINIGSAVPGNQWIVRHITEQPLGVYLVFPFDTALILTGHHTGYNFTLVKGTIVTGVVTDLNSSLPIVNANSHTHNAFSPFTSEQNQFRATTDGSGRYEYALPPGKYFVHFTAYHYFDQWWDHKTGGLMDTITVTGQDTIKNVNGSLVLGAMLSGRVTNWGIGVNNAQVQVSPQANFGQYNSTEVGSDGGWSITVSPGTYYVRFFYNDNIIYYQDHSSSPGDPVSVSGTNIVDHIDANFTEGAPPPPPPPVIVTVKDVPNDQGKAVSLTWIGNEPELSLAGDVGLIGVASFSVERRDYLGANLGWGWTRVRDNVTATHDSLYTVVVPTLFDSTKTNGMHWTKFRVRSVYTFNFYIVDSPPDSGYSLDNLAPGVPGGAGGTFTNGDFVLSWTASGDDDFRYFAVYRSTSPDFEVAGLTPVATTTGTSFTESSAVSGPSYYYKITACDFSGNQSSPTNSISNKTTGVANQMALPSVFQLKQNYPNPFNPSTTIAYELPKSVFVTLRVYNALGQEVATLVQAEQSAGRYTIPFNATRLASGVYVYKLTAGDFTAIRKMGFVK
ncbi:MAG: T9SS type A sorting domain-containing protein [Bacteroidota bacterium]